MKIHAIITARKGSKRFKKKNIFPFKNLPLFLWSVNAAKSSKLVNKTIVSTDDENIIKICKNKKINFVRRPKNLSSDKSSSFSVLKDYCKKIKKIELPDYILLLQPTSPLREKGLIDKSIKTILADNNADRLIELCKLELFWGYVKNNIWKPKFKHDTRSQDIDPIYVPSGRIFIYKVQTTIKKNTPDGKKTISIFEDFSKNINIDYKEDLIKLNFVFHENIKKYLYLLKK